MNIDWLAGFYEGEGCPSTLRSFQLRIGQKHREALDRVQDVFGGNVRHVTHRNGLVPQWKGYEWFMGGKAAVTLALELLKHMQAPNKIEQLTHALVLRGYLTPRSTRETAEATTYASKVRDYAKRSNEAYRTKHPEAYREKQKVGHRKRYERVSAESKTVLEYMRTHPEVVESVRRSHATEL